MIIDGHYDYWRSLCKTLKDVLTQDDRVLPKDVLLSRDISPSWFVITEQMIDSFSKSWTENYLDTEYVEVFMILTLESSIFTDIDIARINRIYGKNHTDLDAAKYALERVVKIVMESVLKIKQK
jgi:hypothetical protein